MMIFNGKIASLCSALGLFLCVSISSAGSLKNKACHDGQAYWCRNISTAAECNAVSHCIRGVWEQEIPYEEDKSSVCQTCIDMVKLARDQLQSNETQEELREVLEGTCKVIPVQALRKDCDKIMDDFGAYIVDTLSSEMNPQVVCQVAGLCFSEKFKNVQVKKSAELNCGSCKGLTKQVERNIQTASMQDLSNVVIGICGKLGSFSEVCASLVHEHMETVDALIRNNIKPDPVCSLAGLCSSEFHSHANDRLETEATALSTVGDDLPCDLCQQLVKHLRDVLIANTTADEFKMIVDALCKITFSKDKCDAMVDEYYRMIYDFLVKELDGKVMCQMIKICSGSGTGYMSSLVIVDDSEVTDNTKPPMQLPLDRMNPIMFVPHGMLGSTRVNPELCSFCEYFLHFIQQEITLPSSERKIAEAVERGCSKLPATVSEQCKSFVQTYMDTFISLIANRIDPSQVCPNLGVCPSALIAVQYKDKPSCPLCLFAMEEILKKTENKTKEHVAGVLDDLCVRDVFPTSISTECGKFVSDFHEPIVDMVLAEFTSQEACVYVDLCSPPTTLTPPKEFNSKAVTPLGNVETNEIVESGNSNACVLCEFIMSKVADALKNKKTEEEIKEAVLHVCDYMPRTVSAQCKTFVNQYADLVLDLLDQEIDPEEVCTALNVCKKAQSLVAGPVKKCLACELLMDSLRTVLTDPDVDEDLNVNLMKACNIFPSHQIDFCRSMVQQLAPQIEAALRTLPVGPLVCRRIRMCGSSGLESQRVQLEEVESQCFRGPEYWCISTVFAAKCQQIEYCQKFVWKNDKPLRGHLKGTDVV